MIIEQGIKAVIHDWDDTIVETKRPKWAQHKYVAREYFGIEVTDEMLNEHYGKPFPEMVEALFHPVSFEIALPYIQQSRPKFPKVIIPEAIRLIQLEREAGKLACILTSSTTEILESDAKISNADFRIFDYIQNADHTSVHKPDPAVFDPIFSMLDKDHKIQPHEIMYIGDHMVDYMAASGAGIEFIGVTTGHTTEEEFRDHGATIVRSLSEIVLL